MAKRNGPSLAQSGGKNSTFGGGKGGTKSSRGATTSRKTGSGVLNNSLQYNIRTTGGDDNKVAQTGRIGTPPPLRGGGEKKARVKVRKPIRGGAS